MGVKRAYDQLSDALFLFASGSNDMFNYYTSSGPRSQAEYEIFESKMVNKLGARRLGFYGASMIGCIPAMRNANPSGECVEDLNLIARIFNKAFLKRLYQLQGVLHHMIFSYGNVYSLVDYTMNNPKEFRKFSP